MDGAKASRAVKRPNDASPVGEGPEKKFCPVGLLNSLKCSICWGALPEHHHVISTCGHHSCYPCIGKNLLQRKANSCKCPECIQLIPCKDRFKILDELSSMEEQSSPEFNALVLKVLFRGGYLTEFEREIFQSPYMSDDLARKAGEQDWDVNAFQTFKGTYLQWACVNGGNFFDQLQIFLSLGADINATDNTSRTPLQHALDPCVDLVDKPGVVRKLLEEGADPNLYTEGKSVTPLMESLITSDECVRVALIRLLLRFGADPEQSISSGEIPLHFCTSPADADTILERCPTLDINHKNNRGLTPLAKAATTFNFEMLTYWINKGADIQCPGVKNHRDLLSAMVMGEGKGSLQKQLSVIKLLLRARGWSSAYDWQSAIKSVVPVSDKCSPAQLEILKLLLEAGKKADLDVAGYINTNHLLHGAIKSNDRQLAKCLLQAGADISVKDENLKDCQELVYESENSNILWLIRRKYPEAGAGQ